MVSPSGSGSGAGGSGSLGAPQSLTPWDVETSAWTQVNKAAMGIVPDSLEVAFSQLTQRYSHSYLSANTGYQATRNQPFLDHPIDSHMLSSLTPLSTDDALIAQNYEDLISQLPPEIRERFLFEAKKPLTDRDPSFLGLDHLFMRAAALLAHVERSSHPAAPDSLEAARTQINLMLPLIALRNLSGLGSGILKHVDNLRNELGSNYRYADDLTDTSIRLHHVLNNLQSIDVRSLLSNEEEQGHE